MGGRPKGIWCTAMAVINNPHYTATNSGRLTVGQDGFLRLDGVKICQVRRGRVEFFDKHRQRSQRRGSAIVSKPVGDFCHELMEVVATQKD